MIEDNPEKDKIALKNSAIFLIFIFNKALCFERRNWEYVWLNDLKSIIFSKWRCILNGKELLEEADIYIRENLLIEVRIK